MLGCISNTAAQKVWCEAHRKIPCSGRGGGYVAVIIHGTDANEVRIAEHHRNLSWVDPVGIRKRRGGGIVHLVMERICRPVGIGRGGPRKIQLHAELVKIFRKVCRRRERRRGECRRGRDTLHHHEREKCACGLNAPRAIEKTILHGDADGRTRGAGKEHAAILIILGCGKPVIEVRLEQNGKPAERCGSHHGSEWSIIGDWKLLYQCFVIFIFKYLKGDMRR